jgi:hypothetical protein
MFKVLNLIQDRFGHLELKFGIQLGFGICDLGFETQMRHSGETE